MATATSKTKAPAKAPARSASSKTAAKPAKAVKPAAPKAATAKPAPAIAAAKPAKAAAPKVAAAKPKAAKPAANSSTGRPAVAPDQRRFYIEVAAYYIAERRGFHGGSELADWAQAEKEIEQLLASGRLNP